MVRVPRSPTRYEDGIAAVGLAATYLAIVALLLTAAAEEMDGAGAADGSFVWGSSWSPRCL